MNDKYIRAYYGLSQNTVYRAYKLFFGTLTSHHRLRIINDLRGKDMSVSELTKKLGSDQTSISHHLARMKRCGFVNVNKRGKYRIYSLNENTIKPMMEIIEKHMDEHCLRIIQKKEVAKK